MNRLNEDLRLNGYALRRVEFGENVAVCGIVAEVFQRPCRQASWVVHEGLEVVPQEILIPFHVLIVRAKECFDI